MALGGSAARTTGVSVAATVVGYAAILVVTLMATFMTIGTALAENTPSEDKADTAITIAVVAAIIVAAIAVVAFTQTTSPSNYRLLLPALLACIALTLAIVLLAYQGTSQAIDYWHDPTAHSGAAGHAQWRLAALITLASPFVAATLAAFRRGAGRIFVVAAALASFAWLAMMAFDQVARTNL